MAMRMGPILGGTYCSRGILHGKPNTTLSFNTNACDTPTSERGTDERECGHEASVADLAAAAGVLRAMASAWSALGLFLSAVVMGSCRPSREKEYLNPDVAIGNPLHVATNQSTGKEVSPPESALSLYPMPGCSSLSVPNQPYPS